MNEQKIDYHKCLDWTDARNTDRPTEFLSTTQRWHSIALNEKSIKFARKQIVWRSVDGHPSDGK